MHCDVENFPITRCFEDSKIQKFKDSKIPQVPVITDSKQMAKKLSQCGFLIENNFYLCRIFEKRIYALREVGFVGMKH